MIKYIKSHLNMQVFLLTFFILIGMAALTYGFVSIITPKRYLAELDRSIDRSVQNLLENSQGLSLDQFGNMLQVFSADHDINIQLYDEAGELIEYGSNLKFTPAEGGTDRTEGPLLQNDLYESKDYQITLGEEGIVYTIKVLGIQQRANLFSASLREVLPWFLLLTGITAILVAWLYARYITKPVIGISAYSRELAELKFDTYKMNDREDEIGILAENLNELSERLDTALTELKTANNRLQADVEREKEMEEQQLAFFSAVSHELKTPVTVLKGQLQGMLYNVGGYKDRDKYLRRSYDVAEGMEGLIIEILSVSRMRSAGFRMKYEKTDLLQMIRQVIEQYGEIAAGRQIEIQQMLEAVPEIKTDRMLFQKAISNVISNAVRYSPEGAHVRVILQPSAQGPLIAVENTGISMAEEDIPALFQAFTRGEHSRNKETGGSGLGLYLVRMILTLHDYPFRMYPVKDSIRFEIYCKQATESLSR